MTSPEQHTARPTDRIPNSRFPLLVHRGAVPGGGAAEVLERFQSNGWLNNWRYPGIYTYGHYHSTTHECLGCAAGWMEIVIFGKGGPKIRVEAGDVVVMPAGVSHEMVANSDDNLMIGGYPDGRDWDNIQDALVTREDFRAAAKRIMMLPIPDRDPVTGARMEEWLNAPSSVDADLNDFRDGLDPE
ncbi:MAG: cupin domain-containing protein [Pseudomonadota bacterium]